MNVVGVIETARSEQSTVHRAGVSPAIASMPLSCIKHTLNGIEKDSVVIERHIDVR